MKVLIGILLVIGLIFGAWKLLDYWETVNREREASQAEAATVADSSSFEGVPGPLEAPLRKAKEQAEQQQRPEIFKQWLDTYRPMIKDPRLGALELDYVVMISRQDPIEAKRMFAEVKKRTPPTSPLYKRIQSLQKTYE